jgi:hypothetical protein
MSIIGQGAREGFKGRVLEVIDKDIKFFTTQSRRGNRETQGIINVLEILKEKIKELDTA